MVVRAQALADHPLVHRRGDHGGELAADAAGDRAIEQAEHAGAVGGIEPPGRRGPGQRLMKDLDHGRRCVRIRLPGADLNRAAHLRRARAHQLDVAEHHQPRRPVALDDAQAQLRADAGRFATGDGDDRPGAASAHAHSRSRR